VGPGGWIALAAVVVTIALWLVERRDRKADARAANAQWASEVRQREELEGKVAGLQAAQNVILSGIGDGIRAAVDPERRETLGARIALSIEASQPDAQGTRYEYLVARNLGPGTARIVALDALDAAGEPIPSRQSPVADLGSPGIELLPGEAHHAWLATTFSSPRPAGYRVRWTDGSSDAVHERQRPLTSPP
jgi:hypothetical protein